MLFPKTRKPEVNAQCLIINSQYFKLVNLETTNTHTHAHAQVHPPPEFGPPADGRQDLREGDPANFSLSSLSRTLSPLFSPPVLHPS